METALVSLRSLNFKDRDTEPGRRRGEFAATAFLLSDHRPKMAHCHRTELFEVFVPRLIDPRAAASSGGGAGLLDLPHRVTVSGEDRSTPDTVTEVIVGAKVFIKAFLPFATKPEAKSCPVEICCMPASAAQRGLFTEEIVTYRPTLVGRCRQRER
jgi:hypothetical protein